MMEQALYKRIGHIVGRDTPLTLDSFRRDSSLLLRIVTILCDIPRIDSIIQAPASPKEKERNIKQILRYIRIAGIDIRKLKPSDVLEGHNRLTPLLKDLFIYYLEKRTTAHLGKQASSNLSEDPLQNFRNCINHVLSPGWKVNNFTADWCSGMALGALIKHTNPGLCCDWRQFNVTANDHNVAECMRLADKHLKIKQVIQPKDMSGDGTDEFTVILYLSQFLDRWDVSPPNTHRGSQVHTCRPGLCPSSPLNYQNIPGEPAEPISISTSASRRRGSVYPPGMEAESQVSAYSPRMEEPASRVSAYSPGMGAPASRVSVYPPGMEAPASRVSVYSPGMEAAGYQQLTPSPEDRRCDPRHDVSYRPLATGQPESRADMTYSNGPDEHPRQQGHAADKRGPYDRESAPVDLRRQGYNPPISKSRSDYKPNRDLNLQKFKEPRSPQDFWYQMDHSGVKYNPKLRDSVVEGNLDIGHELGKGHFCEIHMARFAHPEHGFIMAAMKRLNVYGSSLKDVQDFLGEAWIAKFCNHDNVIKLRDFTFHGGLPCMLLPFYKNGDLVTYLINKKEKSTDCELLGYSVDIASGVSYVMDKGYIHRDLAARNCLVTDDGRVVVADFGFSRDVLISVYDMGSQPRVLPWRWLALEILQGNFRFTKETDVWALGVTLHEVFSYGDKPYENLNITDEQQLKLFLEGGNRLSRPSAASDQMNLLMMKCWSADPRNRPSVDQIVRHLKSEPRKPRPGFQSHPLAPPGDWYDATLPPSDQTHTKVVSSPTRKVDFRDSSNYESLE